MRYWPIFFLNIVPSGCAMKSELDESLLSQSHAPIFDGAKGGEATRAMPELVRLAGRLELSIPPGRGAKRNYSDSPSVLAPPSRNGASE